jgi:hypothetical protein
MTALDTLREHEVARLSQLLDDGELILVYGSNAQEAAEVADTALEHAVHVGRVDVDSCSDDAQVARAIVRAAADALLGDPWLLDTAEDRRTAAEQRSWINVRRRLTYAAGLVGPDGPWSEPAEVIRDTISALGAAAGATTHSVIVLHGVDSLLPTPRSLFSSGDGLLWSIRSAAQHAPALTLVLTGGPETIDLVENRAAAFHGWGRPLELARLDTGTLSAAIAADLGISQGLAALAAERCEGLPAVARLLARWLEDELVDSDWGSDDPVGRAWDRMLADSAPTLRQTTRLIGGLHRSALPVCVALAHGRAPYTAGHPAEVSRALQALRARGICESPAPRTSRLTDPILAAWLRDELGLARQAERHLRWIAAGSPDERESGSRSS